MDKINEFLLELEEELKYLKPKDASEVLKHYREKINIAQDYGDSDEKIIATLPKPSKIAEEIYNSKGIAYLKIRKKQLKRKEILKGIFSGLIVLLILCALAVINIYLISSIIKLGELLVISFKMNTILDIISMSIISLSYIVLIIILMIYIFDLLYILGMHFLYDVLYIFDKKHHDYKFMDFTISGTIENLFKQKKFIFKILIGCIICLVGFGTINYVAKGYMYRSMNNSTIATDKYVVDEDISEIVLEKSEIIVTITQSSKIEKVTFMFGNESNKELEYVINDGKCVLSGISSEKYDFLGLLNEPLSKLEIIIPDSVNLNVIELNINNGSLDITQVQNINNVKCELVTSNLALTKNNFNILNINSSETNLGLSENSVDDAKYNVSSGTFNINQDNYTNLEINNYLAKLNIIQTIGTNVIINSESAINKCTKVLFENLMYKDVSSESTFEDINTNSGKFTSSKNSTISIKRIIAKTNLELTNSNNGNFTLRYVKAPKISTNFSTGYVNLYDINFDDNLTNEDDNSFLSAYNTYSTTTDFNLISYSTNIVIEDVKLNSMNLELNDGRFDIKDGIITRSDIKLNDCDLIVNDLDGKIMYVYVNGGYFSFYNNTIKSSNIELTVEGELIKTTLEIDSTTLKEYNKG